MAGKKKGIPITAPRTSRRAPRPSGSSAAKRTITAPKGREGGPKKVNPSRTIAHGMKGQRRAGRGTRGRSG